VLLARAADKSAVPVVSNVTVTVEAPQSIPSLTLYDLLWKPLPYQDPRSKHSSCTPRVGARFNRSNHNTQGKHVTATEQHIL
jgi:hypothetical protein